MATKEQEIIEKERAETIKRLEEKRDEYVKRLDDGAEKIDEARNQGKDVSSWEKYWCQLLTEYEKICDRIKELQNASI